MSDRPDDLKMKMTTKLQRFSDASYDGYCCACCGEDIGTGKMFKVVYSEESAIDRILCLECTPAMLSAQYKKQRRNGGGG